MRALLMNGVLLTIFPTTSCLALYQYDRHRGVKFVIGVDSVNKIWQLFL